MFDRQLAETLGDVEREMADGSVAVVVMDLDRFQQVNERFGHQVGDLVLIGFAERLASVLPPAGRPARLGGDEFAAIIRTTGTVGHLPDVVTQLHDLLVQQHTIDGLTVTTSVSVGVAIAPIHDGDAETLISTARTAMRRAKRFGTGVEFDSRWFGGVDDRRNHPQEPPDTTESTDTSVQRQLQPASDGLRW